MATCSEWAGALIETILPADSRRRAQHVLFEADLDAIELAARRVGVAPRDALDGLVDAARHGLGITRDSELRNLRPAIDGFRRASRRRPPPPFVPIIALAIYNASCMSRERGRR